MFPYQRCAEKDTEHSRAESDKEKRKSLKVSKRGLFLLHFCRKNSILSLLSLNVSPSVSWKNSPSPTRSQHKAIKAGGKFFKKPSFFNKIKEDVDEPTYQPSSFMQIYKNTKFRLSRSLFSKSSTSSQVILIIQASDT